MHVEVTIKETWGYFCAKRPIYCINCRSATNHQSWNILESLALDRLSDLGFDFSVWFMNALSKE